MTTFNDFLPGGWVFDDAKFNLAGAGFINLRNTYHECLDIKGVGSSFDDAVVDALGKICIFEEADYSKYIIDYCKGLSLKEVLPSGWVITKGIASFSEFTITLSKQYMSPNSVVKNCVMSSYSLEDALFKAVMFINTGGSE